MWVSQKLDSLPQPQCACKSLINGAKNQTIEMMKNTEDFPNFFEEATKNLVRYVSNYIHETQVSKGNNFKCQEQSY